MVLDSIVSPEVRELRLTLEISSVTLWDSGIQFVVQLKHFMLYASDLVFLATCDARVQRRVLLRAVSFAQTL